MKPLMMLMAFLMVISLIFLIWGTVMHAQVNVLEDRFHSAQSKYFTISKSERDAAQTGSSLNQQLVEIKNTPSKLLRLKLVGVGRILTGIYFLLFGILIALIVMPMRLGKMIKGKN